MKARHCIAAALAAFALSGCITYDTSGASAPGGYYSGRPGTQYYYDGYGYPIYGYGYYGYYGYYDYPYYYRHNGGRYYRPPPRPAQGQGNGNDRVPPWRAPATNRDSARPGVRPVQPVQDAQTQPSRPVQSVQSSRPARSVSPARIHRSESRRKNED
ncbi:MAG: hypothetical protein QM599_12250 [Pseudoxanthomonas sp.]